MHWTNLRSASVVAFRNTVRITARRIACSAAGAALLLAAAGCTPTGDLSGSAVGDTTPAPTGAALSEGRGTPTGIGGTVWTDGNANGTFDGQESLDAVITLALWEDVDRDGQCEPTLDTARGTAQSAADGSYHFALTAPGDYCVQVVDGQIPSGWASAISEPVSFGVVGVTLDIALPSH